jgi:hypothetical protein
MNQLALQMDYDYPERVSLQIWDISFLISSQKAIENIVLWKKKIVIEWWLVNVLWYTQNDEELLQRLDTKIDEEMWEVEDEILKFKKREHHNLEWEIADVLEVTQAIRKLVKRIWESDLGNNEVLLAANNTRKYISGIMTEYDINIKEVLKVKKKKLRKRWWFEKWELWWGVKLEDLNTQQWSDILFKLLSS